MIGRIVQVCQLEGMSIARFVVTNVFIDAADGAHSLGLFRLLICFCLDSDVLKVF